jgi:hypothetical protein
VQLTGFRTRKGCLHCIALHPPAAQVQLGHMPQEDFAEALHDSMLPWLAGESDAWDSGKMMKVMKMTKKGAVEVQ